MNYLFQNFEEVYVILHLVKQFRQKFHNSIEIISVNIKIVETWSNFFLKLYTQLNICIYFLQKTLHVRIHICFSQIGRVISKKRVIKDICIFTYKSKMRWYRRDQSYHTWLLYILIVNITSSIMQIRPGITTPYTLHYSARPSTVIF